ncbi:hypothetical protein F0L46_25575, partial [Salinarimonas soli]
FKDNHCAKMRLTLFAFVLAVCALASNATLAPRTDDVLAEQLYMSVVIGEYETAIAKCSEYLKEKKGEVIKEAVKRLIENGKRNTMDFAYQLWTKDGKEIVKSYFPIQFRVIFTEQTVKLINKRDHHALKLIDQQNHNKIAFGDSKDKTSKKVSWKFTPVLENNRVYFKIMSTEDKQYLKLDNTKGSSDDRIIYGDSTADTFKHHWYLEPSMYESDVMFFVYNREYNSVMTLDEDMAANEDREALGHSGEVSGYPQLFAWYIVPY